MSISPTQTLNRAAGDQLCEGSLRIEGALEVTGTSTLGGSLLVTAGTVNAALPAALAADSSLSIALNTVTVCAPVGSSNYNWTISGSGAKNGDWVKVYCNSVGACTLKDPGGNTLLLLDGSGTKAVHAMAVRIAGSWVVCEQGRA